MNGELSAAAAVNKRLPKGQGKTGSWVSVGPSNALYPFFPLRDINLYVPNTYSAAGRTTAMAMAPTCTHSSCRLWIAAAGGGIWRADKALSGNPKWTYLSGGFQINSIGSITQDPNDPSGNTLYVGTGEFNACGSGCVAGVGIYKTTDGGDTWTGPLGNNVFKGRAVGSIAIEPGSPKVIYAGDGRALLGNSSTCCGGAVTIQTPGAQPWGLYKSTDGGVTWTLIHNGAANVSECDSTNPVVLQNVAGNATACSQRGVRDVKLDPSNPSIVYASSYARGVWRSNDDGATWTQIEVPISANDGAIADGNWIGDPFVVPPFNLSREASEFYFPIISDPNVSGTLFAGTEHAWRTTTGGMGSMTPAQFTAHCNE